MTDEKTRSITGAGRRRGAAAETNPEATPPRQIEARCGLSSSLGCTYETGLA